MKAGDGRDGERDEEQKSCPSVFIECTNLRLLFDARIVKDGFPNVLHLLVSLLLVPTGTLWIMLTVRGFHWVDQFGGNFSTLVAQSSTLTHFIFTTIRFGPKTIAARCPRFLSTAQTSVIASFVFVIYFSYPGVGPRFVRF